MASECGEFSFAYLKELVISSVMHWMQDGETPFVDVILNQANVLRQQMKTDAEDEPSANARPQRRGL